MVELADQFRAFALAVERDGTALYAAICRGVAADPDLLALAAEAPPAQRRPNLLLAAVHYLLLSGVDDPLAGHYPTVAEWRDDPGNGDDPHEDGRGRVSGTGGGGRRPPTDPDPFVDFAAFCRRHRAELSGLLASRATQTNEVGRCTALLPAFVTVAATAGRPLGLVDLGAAAGLNLLFDHYTYRYTTSHATSAALSPAGPSPGAGPVIDRPAGSPTSPVVLACELRSGVLPDRPLPPVAYRAGLDQRPIDLDDDRDARWLLACQWPEQLERFRRLRAAVGLARATPGRGRVGQGDMVDDLLATLEAVPEDAHACLFHSWAAAYLPEGRQRELAGVIGTAARARPLSWIFAEQPYEVPGLPVPAAPGGMKVKGATALVVVDFEDGRPRARRLADLHPHGRWLHWWDSPPSPGTPGPALRAG